MDDVPPRWLHPGTEPHLEDLLADPTLRTLLARDKLTVEDVRALARRARERLRPH